MYNIQTGSFIKEEREVQEENEQLRFALEEIGKIAGKLGK